MIDVALDSSVIINWVLKTKRSGRANTVITNPDVTPILAGPVLTEVLHVCRREGNMASFEDVWASLVGYGARVEHPTDDDLVRAATLRLTSDAHPGPAGETLSLGDALILAVVERLGIKVVTDDSYWRLFATDGHTAAQVVDYSRP